ncbi:microviridin/marinostatin family tricyclic proteinase inhibitor [Flavobacterium amniphilum]|uniref:microviridin/marinostatin family tricyclic proteinase inhibitor n=1 Tax=Flavobacterium amniphilum TaxID=1834035 RepID=UPI002029D979|nr:microviridin/marinostatin family tricyclic proteinase inhibitor [Flavobacterium amniphilum]MCL9804624.1 microviridin/marinostatin family tricyclic proteinase inhibitor [Flavobacterium amniphilum]
MKKNELKKPFFASFLENQMSKEEANAVQGGAITSVLRDTVQTMKYPSDGEEGPGGTTKPSADVYETMKYPSDSDEDGTAI